MIEPELPPTLFCMLYGGISAIVSEILARLLKKNIKKE
jgi:hypothetical protein